MNSVLFLPDVFYAVVLQMPGWQAIKIKKYTNMIRTFSQL